MKEQVFILAVFLAGFALAWWLRGGAKLPALSFKKAKPTPQQARKMEAL